MNITENLYRKLQGGRSCDARLFVFVTVGCSGRKKRIWTSGTSFAFSSAIAVSTAAREGRFSANIPGCKI